MSYFNKPLDRYEKPGYGFATEADRAAEDYLITALARLVPEASFHAEESGTSGDQSSDYVWVIDPLDGTTNFSQGLPIFSISVALTYQGVPVLGMIHQPLLDELYYAAQGQGAWLNGKRIAVSSPRELKKGIVVVALPYAHDPSYMKLFAQVRMIAPRAYAFRHLGSAALDLAYVAAGRLDGVFMAKLGWWDVAAGMVLVSEAGGIVTNFAGKSIGSGYKSLVAAGPQMHEQLLTFLDHDEI